MPPIISIIPKIEEKNKYKRKINKKDEQVILKQEDINNAINNISKLKNIDKTNSLEKSMGLNLA